MVGGSKRLGLESLRDARHADRRASAATRRRPGSMPTTTISIRPPNTTARSSRRAPIDDRLETLGAGAPRRHDSLLRRHRRHGESRGTAWPDRTRSRPRPIPESVPINLLVRVAGTPLGEAGGLDAFEFVRTIATAASPCRAGGAAVRRAQGDDGRGAGALLPRRGELDLQRRAAAHDARSRARSRCALFDRLGSRPRRRDEPRIGSGRPAASLVPL